MDEDFNDDSTDREKTRKKEDRESIPVIIKRTDEVSSHPEDTLERAINEGREQHHRSNLSLFLSSVSAGLILGFAAMCVALVYYGTVDLDNTILRRFFVGCIYPLGFIICIGSGTQLFTEQTATAVYPVLDRRSPLTSLVRLWSVVLAGNLVGTFISSILIFSAESSVGAAKGAILIAEHLTSAGAYDIFVSAVLAGWLMAQGGWLILRTSSTTSQLVYIYIVTFVIGFAGFNHSIAGSAEIFSGILHSRGETLDSSMKFLVFAVLGNLVGGSFFVGILNYAHIKKTKTLN